MMSCSFTRVVAVVTLLAAAVSLVDGDKRVCTYHSGVAINASDIAPPTFTVSANMCCGLCKSNATCRAAQYNTQTYYCHLKGALGPMIIETNVVVVTLDQPTPPPTPAPTPSPPPPPFTAAFFTTCWYESYNCMMESSDETCLTTALECGKCAWTQSKESHLATCAKDVIVVQRFDSNNCSGPVRSSKAYDNLGNCYLSGGLFQEQFIAANLVASPGAIISSSRCDLGCGSCQATAYIGGQCVDNGDGTSTIGICTKDYVFYQSFTDSRCSGPSAIYAYPNNVCYDGGWEDSCTP